VIWSDSSLAYISEWRETIYLDRRTWNICPEVFRMKLNIITLLIGITALSYGAYYIITTHQPWTPLKITGVAIVVPAFILFLMARIQLGSNFAIQAKAQSLVTTGVYSRIRNPIYVFGMLIIVGVALYFRPIYLIVLAVLIPMQIIRSRAEEKVLAEKFGDEYQRYKAKTWF
jgi:protein-S-isoprenylcysteine O-methyltransferase Ste14